MRSHRPLEKCVCVCLCVCDRDGVGCDGGVVGCSVSHREKGSVQKGKLCLNSRTREMA